jgi:general secretion pathway protein G
MVKSMKRHSFTLLELLVSIGIILVLAAISFGGMTYASKRAQEAKTIATMEEFINALESFKQDYGFYPIIDKDAAVAVNFDVTDNANKGWKLFMNEETKPNKKNRAYMEGELGPLVDAYGQEFQYRYPGVKNKAKYDLWSKGPDKTNGKKGGDTTPGADDSDDICSWKQR